MFRSFIFSFKRLPGFASLALGCVSMFAFASYSFYAVPALAAAEKPSAESLLKAKGGPVGAAIYHVLEESGAAQDFLKDEDALSRYYYAREYKPRWVSAFGVNDDAEEMLEVIRGSWVHGLNPQQYHLSEIEGLMGAKDAALLGDLELVLSDAYIRLGRDLTGIRIDPGSMDTHRSFWRQPMSTQELLMKLEVEGSGKDAIEAIAPKGRTYKILQETLAALVREPPAPYEAVLPLGLKNARFLKPYERDEAVVDIKVRLGIDPEVEKGADPYVYDDKLAKRILEVQRYYGLKADGIIGAQTLDVLNVTRQDKIEQVVANLERLRWVEESKPDKYVVVNVPSTTLWAVEDGRVAFEMPVIVGKQERPTNTFITEIHGVRFNPTWTVPPTIKKEDMLPKLRENPVSLRESGMEVMMVQGQGHVSVDPESIDWNRMSQSDMRYFKMVQTPGAHNPLGQIRVLMPNRYNIYLHDTNKREYFERASQALSSGCVRMKEPARMADFIMKTRRGWGEGSVEEALASGEMRDLYLEEPIAVYMLYYTVWINEGGEVVYGRDLYGYDKKLIKILRNIDGIFNFVDNNRDSAS